jgi:hypothetical protein
MSETATTSPSRLGILARAARDLPAAYVALRGARRLGLESAWLRRAEFLAAPDSKRPTKPAEILQTAMANAGLDFAALLRGIKGGVVIEIGCGRHAGFAPLAAMLGAEGYIGIDPALEPELFQHPAVERRYLRPALAAAARLAGRPEPDEKALTDALKRLHDIASFRPSGLAEALRAGERGDLCVSISCLEHIGDFEAAASSLAGLTAPGAAHLHLVNFSNHLVKGRPFDDLYEREIGGFAAHWDGMINGLRLPDMLTALEKSGLSLQAHVLNRAAEALPAKIDPSWTEAYDRDTLAIRTALITNIAPAEDEAV